MKTDDAPTSPEYLYKVTFEPVYPEVNTVLGELTLDISPFPADGMVELDCSENVVILAITPSSPAESIPMSAIEFLNRRVRFHVATPGPVHVKFRTTVDSKMNGIYRSRVTPSDFILVTQFEPIAASNAFPCVDKPAHKAAFELTLVVPEELEALSNTGVRSIETHSPGRKAVAFVRTPKMATYLLAFAVGKFVRLARLDNTPPIRVLAAANVDPELLRFALDKSATHLRLFEQLFGVPYPLDKLDLLALPDFEAGAMENWGLVTFRESMLLVGAESSRNQRDVVDMVVAHELAHMWFGNLVTMCDWDELWLNEGFATFWEYEAAAVEGGARPNEFDRRFLVENTFSAMAFDALESSHALQVALHGREDIKQVFDAVSYAKGAAVLAMVRDYVGPAKFEAALHRYVGRYQFGNAKSHQLWESFESGEVATIMRSFVEKAGFPVVSMALEGRRLTLAQQRYFRGDQRSAETWVLPVRVAVLRAGKLVQSHTELMRGASATLDLDSTLSEYRAGDLLVLNPGQRGFFLPHFDFAPLFERATWPRLGPLDQLAACFNVCELITSRRLGLDAFQRLADCLRADSDFRVTERVVGFARRLLLFLEGEARARFRDKVVARLEDVFAALGKTEAADLRSVNTVGCFLLDQGSERVRTAEVAETPDTREFRLLRGLLEDGGFERTVGLFKAPDTFVDTRTTILRALGRVQRRDLVEKALAFCMDDAVRDQDRTRVLVGMRLNGVGAPLLPEFVAAHFAWFKARFGPEGLLEDLFVALQTQTGQAVSDLCDRLAGTEKGLRMVLAQTKENIHVNRLLATHINQ